MKLLFAAIATISLSSFALASPPAASLRNASPCCLEDVFRQGTVGCSPSGRTKGFVLYADGKHPRLKARMQGTVWKGKTFHCDGTFTNRWIGGISAGSAGICVEPSWLDGQPCFVMQYGPNAPVFANVRDELREIEPGVWLGRSYDSTTGCPKNWFMLRCK